jgi:hypothetical protein
VSSPGWARVELSGSLILEFKKESLIKQHSRK